VQPSNFNKVTHLEEVAFLQKTVTAITQINHSITNTQLREFNGALTVCYDDCSENNFDNKREIVVSD
jgi:hypothetical protein